MLFMMILVILVPVIVVQLTGNPKWYMLAQLGAAMYPAWLFLNGAVLRKSLHKKGYTWLTFLNTTKLFSMFHLRCYKLPPRDEMAVIPGYDDNIESLRKFINADHYFNLNKDSS
jgi:hypothetical protein